MLVRLSAALGPKTAEVTNEEADHSASPEMDPILLEVVDTGIGIADTSDFVQVSPHLYQRYGGTELGLSITMMGGSERGKLCVGALPFDS